MFQCGLHKMKSVVLLCRAHAPVPPHECDLRLVPQSRDSGHVLAPRHTNLDTTVGVWSLIQVCEVVRQKPLVSCTRPSEG